MVEALPECRDFQELSWLREAGLRIAAQAHRCLFPSFSEACQKRYQEAAVGGAEGGGLDLQAFVAAACAVGYPQAGAEGADAIFHRVLLLSSQIAV